MKPPLTNEEISALNKDELLDYAEQQPESFILVCIHDKVELPQSYSYGTVTKIEIPAREWVEIWEAGRLVEIKSGPFSRNDLKKITTKCVEAGRSAKIQSHGEILRMFYKDMTEGRVRIEILPDEEVVFLKIPSLGCFQGKAKELRSFLRGWEHENATRERSRLDYSKETSKLGKLSTSENSEIKVIFLEGCKLAKERLLYERKMEAYQTEISDAICAGQRPIAEPPRNPDNADFGRERNLILEALGRKVIAQMSYGDHRFFTLLAEAAKYIDPEKAFIQFPRKGNDRKSQTLLMASELIKKTGTLPTKQELYDAVISEHCDDGDKLYDDRQYRRDLSALGLAGLPKSK